MSKDYFNLNSYVCTNVGKVRQNNEDNFLFDGKIVDQMQSELTFSQKTNTDNICLYGVFDGMGGHEQGEKASLMSAMIARDFMVDEDYIAEGLNQICLRANEDVCQEMKRLKQRIGSTASMVAFYKKDAHICNIGDTPIYLYRNHTLYQLHEEHTERKMYEKIYGHATPNKKYRLTQNIGVFQEEMMIKPYVSTMEVLEGDCFIICSDGLTDMVSEEQIAHVLEAISKERQVQVLESEALKAGGKDNITIMIIHVEKKSIFDRFRK